MPSTWDKLAGPFQNHLRTNGKSAETARSYVANMAHFCRWAAFHEYEPLIGLERDTIDDYLNDQFKLVDAGRLTNHTIRNRIYALRCFYDFCIAREWRADNPTRGMNVKRPRPVPKKALDTTQLQRIIKEAPILRDQALWCLLADTGLRIGEAVRVQVQDIDWREQCLLVVHGKGNKQRRVPFSVATSRILAQLVGEQTAGPVFKTMEGNPLGRDRARQNFGRHVDRLGIKAFPHQLRITYANLKMEEGIPLDALQSLLGHSDISTTAHYAGAGRAERAIAWARKHGVIDQLFTPEVLAIAPWLAVMIEKSA